jgi:hypothetical protein
MAKLKGGILGSVSGKVAGVVAGQWKDKNYVRQYAVPSNPNTAGQQTQRGKFGKCVAFAKLIVGQILNVFVDPFQKSMSGFNYFIKQNIEQFGTSTEFGNIAVTDGKLYFEGANEPTKSGTNLVCTFGTGTGANGAATDKINAFVVELDETNEIIKTYFSAAAVNRSTGTISVAIGATLANRYMRVYLWAAQYDTNGTLVMVSRSSNNSATIEP